MIRTESQACASLGRLEELLHQCVHAAWDDYANPTLYGPQSRAIHTLRTQATIVRDHMVYHARQLFGNIAGVTFVERGQLFLLNVENDFVIKLKRLDRALRTANIPTQLALDFNEQTQLSLPGLPNPVTHLHLGYQLNRTKSGMAKVYVTCPDGSRVFWAYELEAPAISAFNVVTTMPRFDDDKPQRRVRPRQSAGPKSAATDDGKEGNADTASS